MADTTVTQDNALDEIIKSMREEREREKAAKKALDESLKSQTELNKASTEAAQKIADANLSMAEAESISAKAKVTEASEKAKISSQEIKNEKKKLDQEKTRKTIDDSNVNSLVDQVETLKEKNRRIAKEDSEFNNLAEKLGQIREMIKSPIERLYSFAADKAGFDIKKRPISTAIGIAGLTANTIVNQDKVPPIFGILVKAITGGLIFVSGILERNFERIVNKFRGIDNRADELIRTEPVLRELAGLNKKLALELATLRVRRFDKDVVVKGKEEKEFLIRERSERLQNTSNESILKNVTETIKDSKTVEPEISLNKEPNLFSSNRPNVQMVNKIDELILLVKNINNQFDPEVDTERYNAEVSWRKEVIEKLESLRTGKVPEAKTGISGLLEGGAFASIASFVGGVVTSVGKFLLPLGILSKGLLRFATPLGLAASLLMTLDWQKDLLEPINKIKSTFADGNYLEGIFRSITLPTDIVVTFVNRSLASIAGFFGFDEAEKELNTLADSVNFVDAIMKLKTNLFKYINDITSGVDFNFSGLKDNLASKFDSLKDIVAGFDITKSIKELFDFISDKIESLKFWKTDKTFKTPEFIQKLIPERMKQNIDTIKINNENNISSSKTIERIESSISKLDPSRNIKQLSQTHEKLIEKQTTKENTRLERLTDKLGNINTSVVNQQVNNSSVTSIAGRPRARIEDNYGYRNHGSDFSGYMIN